MVVQHEITCLGRITNIAFLVLINFFLKRTATQNQFLVSKSQKLEVCLITRASSTCLKYMSCIGQPGKKVLWKEADERVIFRACWRHRYASEELGGGSARTSNRAALPCNHHKTYTRRANDQYLLLFPNYDAKITFDVIPSKTIKYRAFHGMTAQEETRERHIWKGWEIMAWLFA